MVVAADDEDKCCTPLCKCLLILLFSTIIVIIGLWAGGVISLSHHKHGSKGNNGTGGDNIPFSIIPSPEFASESMEGIDVNDVAIKHTSTGNNYTIESFGILIIYLLIIMLFGIVFPLFCLNRKYCCAKRNKLLKTSGYQSKKHIMNPSLTNCHNYNTFFTV